MTLLETLLALAIVLALGSVVVVAMDRTLERRQFERGTDLLEEHVRLARAHASRTGEAVEIVFNLDTDSLLARRYMPESDVESMRGPNDAPAFSAGGSGLNNEGFVALTDVRTIEEPWAEREWPERCGVQRTDPRSMDAFSEFQEEFGSELDDAGLDVFAANEVRLTVLLPDGTAAQTSPVFLWDGEKRLVRMSVDPWIGVVRAETLVMNVDGRLGAPDLSEDDVSTPDSPENDASRAGSAP